MFRATVFRVAGAVVLSAGLFPPPVATAQEPAGQDGNGIGGGGIQIELNRASDNESGGCGLVVMTTNRLPQGIRRAAWQMAIFDAEGVVKSLPVLDFGALSVGKHKIGIFQIPDGGCDTIGRIIINDVAECTAEDGGDLGPACLSGLETRNRTDIEFGL